MRLSAIYQNGYKDSMFDLHVTTIENTILQSCTYILTRHNYSCAYLVDCGDVVPILNFMEKNNNDIEGVLLTHCHYDHIYGLNDLLLRYPDLKVIASEKTFLGLEDDDLSMSYLYTDEDYMIHLTSEQKITIGENTHFKVFNEDLECISTPGHDVDCMSYIIGNAIFTGDSYNPNKPVFTKWQNSDEVLALRNEALLKNLVKERRLKVYPGHLIEYND